MCYFFNYNKMSIFKKTVSTKLRTGITAMNNPILKTLGLVLSSLFVPN